MTGTVLQTGWLYAAKPRGLPIWLLVVGLQLLILGGLWKVYRQHPGFGGSKTGRLSLLALGGGYLFSALSVIRTDYGAYAAFLFLLFRGLEGAAAVRFYRKVTFVLRNRRTPSGSNVSSFVTRRLLVFFFGVVGVGLLVSALAPGAVERAGFSVANPRGLYTAVTFSFAMLGVYWRLAPVRDDYNWLVLIGFGFSVAGAELFNYAALATEVALSFAGGVAYAVGFWALVGCWQLGLVRTTPSGSP
ncbi:MAG: hypothetical protein ABEI80_08855 [Haloplanus sp.]